MAKVLVVDDAAFMRARTVRTLVEEGYEVQQAENGVEAVRLYAAWQPDAVLMDITMPEMDGLEALRAIRASHPDARIAMLSAMGQQSVVMEALKAGARECLVKPCQPDRVVAAVEKLLAA